MSSRSKYSRKKMLLPVPLTAVAAALRTGLRISSDSGRDNIESFKFTQVKPEIKAYLDSMTMSQREALTETKGN